MVLMATVTLQTARIVLGVHLFWSCCALGTSPSAFENRAWFQTQSAGAQAVLRLQLFVDTSQVQNLYINHDRQCARLTYDSFLVHGGHAQASMLHF